MTFKGEDEQDYGDNNNDCSLSKTHWR